MNRHGLLKQVVLFTFATLCIVSLVTGVCAVAEGSTGEPENPVKLIFIHHSTGEHWLADNNGGLGIALRDNNYFVSDTNYDWGPNSIGSYTDIGDWWTWFRSTESPQILADLFNESAEHSTYSRLSTDPGGQNKIVMLKSCFPNSNLRGNPNDPVPPITANLLKANNSYSEYHTVANAKGIYIDLLEYFRTKPDTLFIVVAAPPLSAPDNSANARTFNQWLANDWLTGYNQTNVVVWDFYNVLTTNGGNTYTNDLNISGGNHHRWWNNSIQHTVNMSFNTSAYPVSDSDDHPTQAGNLKSTGEFIPLLNFAYNRWAGHNASPVANFTANVTSGIAPLTVQFYDNSTGTPTRWNWSFGDGNFSALQNPVHTYPCNGSFTVTLHATNTSGSNVSVRTNYIVVMVPKPYADFSTNVTSGTAPLPVSFTDLSSNNPTGWAWFFGDETYTAPCTQMTAAAGWTPRDAHSSVTMPDGSLVLLGGYDNGVGVKNDVWRSPDNGATWIQMNASAGWTPRYFHTSVAMPDGSIVLLGGYASGSWKNDVWRSKDNGATWTQMNASAGWAARALHSSVIMPDGSIVLMGGQVSSGGYKNDVWRSTDNGATWTQMNASAGWAARYEHTSVAMPDGNIILMGGYASGSSTNDVWRSSDNGATWTQVTAHAGWSARYGHTSVAMPDGSVVLMGGETSSTHLKNDVWRSTDTGATWTQVNASAGWSPRDFHSSVMMPDGSIVLLGGQVTSFGGFMNDVWRIVPIGSSVQSPVHTYTTIGTYPVSLQVYNSVGYNCTKKTGYITVTGAPLPGANFTANVTSGTAPLAVQFTDTSTGTPTSWNWSFGDGALATVQNPVHMYATTGTYTVSLNATNTLGSNITTRIQYISVNLPVQGANFRANVTAGALPLPVSFTDLSSNTLTGWAWFFGDETYTAPWTQVNASAAWSARYWHSSVAMPDGSIVLMGGLGYGGCKNDVWRSTNNGATWTQVCATAGWSARYEHTSVVMPDGSIVLMGGYDGSNKNDVWRSTDNGVTWTRVNASAGWSARNAHTSVVMPDGSIVLMGGYDGSYKNDTWRSTDLGVTWTQVNASAGWSARNCHSSVVMPDGSIVLMGGYDGSNKNDVWRSTNNGATWTQVTASAAWSARNGLSSVAMPDGSIVLMGGDTSTSFKNDVWRSTDNGLSWTYVTASAAWSGRYVPRGVAMPDGSIVLMGGFTNGGDTKNDVWRFVPTGSSAQNPVHTYTTVGTYQVALQAYDVHGFNSTRKTGYITVTGAPVPGVNFRANVTAGALPLPVSFTDLSSNTPTGWAWYFGDENFTAPWTQVNASAGWSDRYWHSSVAMPDGSIVLMGGLGYGGCKNDVWRSTDNGVTWTQQTANAWSTSRYEHTSVVMPDGSIVLMGGYDGSNKNDVWRSTDNGVTWTRVNASAGWSARNAHTSVVMPDGSIVLMGGYDGSYKNDTWRSTDLGVTWTQVNASAGWSARNCHSSVVMPDGSIVLMGGYDGSNKNDVWRSTNNGATWTQVTASAAWSARNGFSSVAMPDGSIVLMGGDTSTSFKNDVWRSTDNGLSWTYVTASAAWSGRYVPRGVAMPDGSIVLMGGFTNGGDTKNDVWRFVPTGSSAQNPVHTYTTVGTYQVALQAYDVHGFNSTRKTGYITVTGAPVPGVNFRANVTAGALPLPVSFTDLSSNTPTGWAWYFGDENFTAPWTQVNASAGWSDRYWHSSVAMPDGSIVLMGGLGYGGCKNDVWRSTDNGVTWTQQTANAWSTSRYEHTSVVMPDGSIVLMGGYDGSNKNDVWRSTDNGVTWTRVNASAGWSARNAHTSVVMPDGSIVLMGGYDGSYKNDTWRSTDLGVTWTQVNASAGWSARNCHSSVVMPDGSIVLMGGYDGSNKNDVWRSTNNGATWTQVTASAAWSARNGFSSVAMPDGSIVLMGGDTSTSFKNDVWRSTDNGLSWTYVTASAAWSGRYVPRGVAMPDGSIVLMGGFTNGGDTKNDVWRFVPTGSSAQNPVHTYSVPGSYQVALQAYDVHGYNSTRKTGYVTVTTAPVPVANFSATPRTGYAPLTVTFIDLSTGTPTSWNWSFGDTRWFNTTTATARNVTHDYTSSGIYTVSLIAASAGGSNTKTESAYINITAPPSPIGANGTVINQSATVFIGEEGLNLTHALNQAQEKPVMKGEPALKTIGWWAPGSPVDITSPTRILDLNGRYTWFTVEPSDFVGYTGTWYVLRENQTAVREVFTVADPTLDMKILDYTHIMDVTGKSVPQNTRLGFGIVTNMYPAVDDKYRSPICPATDGYITITVKNATGSILQSLYNNSASAGTLAGPHSLRANFVNTQPWAWGGNDTWAWQTSARDRSDQYAYPPGTYTVTAESTLNHMKDNYRFHGADYTGKTVSPPYTITLRVCGDFNGNNIVDIGDASRVAHMVVGLTPMDMAADFNTKGTVDAGDAAKIAWFLVGKVPAL